MNVSMWVKALRVVPRLSKDEWDKLDIVSRWLVATRSFALVLSFMAAAIGGLLAARDEVFALVPWLLTMIGLVFAHGTNNLLNDLVDYQKGVDKANYYRAQYGPQPLESGLMTKKQLLTYAVVTGLIAALCGACSGAAGRHAGARPDADWRLLRAFLYLPAQVHWTR